MPYDLRPFLRWIVEEFEPSVRVGGVWGAYASQPGGRTPALYGMADMACVLHTIGVLEADDAAARMAEGLAGLQDPSTGYLRERGRPTHSAMHNTAFALGALHLLGRRSPGPLRFAAAYDTPETLGAFLDRLDWREGVYKGSHDGAGLAAACALVPGTVAPSWFDAYFDALDALFDPANGMLGVGKPAGGDFDQIGGTFHYAFMYEHFRRRMPLASARIDAVIGLQRPDGLWRQTNTWWLTLDAIYLLSRSVRHGHHRAADAAASVRRALDNRYALIAGPDVAEAFAGPMSVHRLTAAINLFAEAQQFLGAGEVVTDWPLRLVLDARPFI